MLALLCSRRGARAGVCRRRPVRVHRHCPLRFAPLEHTTRPQQARTVYAFGWSPMSMWVACADPDAGFEFARFEDMSRRAAVELTADLIADPQDALSEDMAQRAALEAPELSPPNNRGSPRHPCDL